jgi:hypothetical protein
LQQLLELCNATLVDMDDSDIVELVDSQPALSMLDIPAGIYTALPKFVLTFGSTVSLIASGSLDEETAYKIMEALDQHQQNLKSTHTALSAFTVGPDRKRTVGIELHPGAAKYFSEQ